MSWIAITFSLQFRYYTSQSTWFLVCARTNLINLVLPKFGVFKWSACRLLDSKENFLSSRQKGLSEKARHIWVSTRSVLVRLSAIWTVSPQKGRFLGSDSVSDKFAYYSLVFTRLDVSSIFHASLPTWLVHVLANLNTIPSYFSIAFC